MTRSKGKARAKASKRQRNKQKNDNFLRKKYLIKEIRKYDEFPLDEECTEVFQGEDVKDIFKKMKYSLNATNNGVGLASNQIGITKRMIIIKPDSDSNDITYMINPEIESTSGKMRYGREGCLSYPEIYGMIERYTSIEVTYHDENWKKHTVEYKEGNILGVIVQHELDHLSDGHCPIYDWWKDPEGKQKELEEKFKLQEEQKQEEEQTEGYEIEESEDLQKEKSEIEVEIIKDPLEEDNSCELSHIPNAETEETFEKTDAGEDLHSIKDTNLLSNQIESLKNMKEDEEEN